MKKYGLAISCIIMALGFVLILPGFHAMAGEKTGFVDIREVLLNSDAGKKAAEEIKNLYEKNKKIIQEREAELKKLKDEVEKQSSILTEAARKEKESDYQKKLRDYQLMVKDINEELKIKDQEFANRMLPEILKVLAAIGEKEKYSLILETSSLPVAYFAKENDMTKRVVEELNKTSKPQK
ncbi:MAG: OmpH family outer membrane protein [Syntrophales bacterium]|nr:OmpH family outer membrane protein [Syntrophales bacterium]